jgi:hypothetical protein
MAHIDLYLHLLPGVREAGHAARRRARDPAGPLTIPDRSAALQAALDREGIALRLRPGGTRPHDRRLHGSLERARQARRRLVRSR